ncbi:Riboflavin-binding protein RibY [Cupriavidus yeoncheonensis]|uniref:Thiamine pyrimidine synthase n=1 Tax=Cupriavidus yeoncheonensis TaxID=1462994 RepID=A0A916IWX3_9BURK|nr:ABC transporter substrate-binding protein [Cupriavidus yeoncheonensis]CAG2150654.1 Riboflavin-binding protein RibY [Cupriavidus yeoncheonensis]
MKVHRIKAMVAALALAALATGPALAADKIDKVVYQLGWIPSGANGIEYLGKADGYFSRALLDVEIRSGNGSSDALTRVAAGSADMTAVGIDAVFAAAARQKLPVRIIYSIYNKKPDAIHVAAASPIHNLKDLAGKRLATSVYSSVNVVWPLFLQKNGVDPASVRLMKVDAGTLAPLVASGQVDGALDWVTSAPGAASVLKSAGKSLREIKWSEYGYDGYGYVIVANENFLKQKPEVARHFLDAYRKASMAAVANPSAVGSAMARVVPGLDAKVAGEEFSASIPLIENEITRKDGWGAFDAARVRATWDWVARSQGLPGNALDPMSVIDAKYLPASK